ncbi:MAG: hypothetical protein MZV49_09345 [Rhodopseudomonas palustris]|nr:hypothetical protein [Rhodopseudomonas palustris]
MLAPANILALVIRTNAGKAIKAYENQIILSDKLSKENALLDKELAKYEAGAKASELINPGKILLSFVSAGEQQVRLQSFSFDKNRFVIRGTAKNAIGFVETLKATGDFVSLSLTGVQPETDGRERFSLSGEYRDQP